MSNIELSDAKSFECRYCLVTDQMSNLISPCKCQGSLKYVHVDCLAEWMNCKGSISALNNFSCEICKYNIKYNSRLKNSFWKTLLIMLSNIILSKKHIILFILHSAAIYFINKRLKLLIRDLRIIYGISGFAIHRMKDLIHSFIILLSLVLIFSDIIVYYIKFFSSLKGIKTYTFSNYL